MGGVDATQDLTCKKICQERGRVSIDKPQAITAKKELVNLNDMALLLEAYQALSAVDFSKLSESYSILGALNQIKNKCHGPNKDCGGKSAIVLMVDTLTVEKFNEEEQRVADSLLADLKKINKKFSQLLDKKNPLLSPKTRDEYKKEEKNQTGHLHDRAIKALKIMIGRKGLGLSVDAKKKLNIRGGDAWIDKLNTGIISLLIRLRCKPGIIKKAEPKPKPKPKPEPAPKSKPKFDWSLRLGSGYGLNPIGKEQPELLAAQERGILMQSAASGKLDIARRLYLQIDYNFSAPYDVQGGDNLVSNYDFGRVSLAAGPLDNLDLLAQVGWLYYRNDYPSKETPDTNALVENLRINWKLFPGFSLNLDQSLLAGWTNESFPEETSDFHLIRAMGEAGASYQAGPCTPFIGGIGGHGEDGEIYGGYIGTGLNLGELEVNLRAQYRNDEGLSAAARYFFNQKDWGIGGQLFYINDIGQDLEDQYKTGAGVVARFAIAEFWGNVLEVQPFANVAFAMDSDSALNINGGILLRFGALRPAQPSSLRPYSIESLPEAK